MEVVVPGAQTGHIEEAKEYRFFLYRHWSLFDSMCYSPYVAAKLAAWQTHGTGRLQVRIYCVCVRVCLQDAAPRSMYMC